MTTTAAPPLFRPMPLPGGPLTPLSIDRVSCPALDRQIAAVKGGTAVDVLLCCLLDTDPSVQIMTSAAAEFVDLLATGLERLAAVSGARKIVVAADPVRPMNWAVPLKGRISSLKIAPIRADYPQTDPTLMLYTVGDRRLVPGRLPTDAGVMLVDAVAAIALGRRALDPAGPVPTPVAVLDHFTGVTHLLDVPVGTPLDQMLGFLDLATAGRVVRSGDFLRDQWCGFSDRVGNGEVVFHVTAAAAAANPDPCIRCGWCVEACPTRVSPVGLLEAAQDNDLTAARGYGLHACIECGVCTYVCPTRLPLLASIRTLRRATR
jgi:electron transport complex protein RnfC